MKINEIRSRKKPQSFRSSYFTKEVKDTIGARDIYNDIEHIRVFKMILDEPEVIAGDVYLVVSGDPDDTSYGFVYDSNGQSYSIDNKVHYDINNIDDRIEDLLNF